MVGATGSIGLQAIDVVSRHADRLRLVALAVGRQWEQGCVLARQVQAQALAVASPPDAEQARRALAGTGIEVLEGDAGVRAVAAWPGASRTLVAAAGIAGLGPTCAALEAGHDVALANKESLVAGGALVTALASRHGARILPVDSEHSAVFQCLGGRSVTGVSRIWLTASGGPFRQASAEEIAAATPERALRHPTWRMGPRVTVDSASLFNKGLEVIEASWLFGLSVDAVAVVVHPQSIVHSLVEFVDGSWLAQCAPPDMRLPIQVALSWPERWSGSPVATLDWTAIGHLDFEPPDRSRFPCLDLAYEAARMGGTAPAALNAADEVAVERFLAGDIAFGDIPRVLVDVLAHHNVIPAPALEDVLWADAQARERARGPLRLAGR